MQGLESAKRRFESPDLHLAEEVKLIWIHYDNEIVGAVINHLVNNYVCEGFICLAGKAKLLGAEQEWYMIGDFDCPTLSPSILCHCGLHGYIKSGKWVEV